MIFVFNLYKISRFARNDTDLGLFYVDISHQLNLIFSEIISIFDQAVFKSFITEY